jgi:hypothetical protein
MPDDRQDVTKLNEQTVHDYFLSRGWEVEELDRDNSASNADFSICRDSYCFLCEAKTIRSVVANIPYSQSDSYFLEQRDRRRQEVQSWKDENPDKTLSMAPEEWDHLLCEESEFRKRYQTRQRYTRHKFERFARAMREYFAGSSVSSLPYKVRLDSDDCYVPGKAKREQFFGELERELRAIDAVFHEVLRACCAAETSASAVFRRVMDVDSDRQAPTLSERRAVFETLTTLLTAAHRYRPGSDRWRWAVGDRPHNVLAYWLHYQIRKPQDEYDPGSTYALRVEGPRRAGGLEIDAFCYGELNYSAIDRNVHKAVRQLRRSAEAKGSQLPRVIVLAFAGGLGREERTLPRYVADWLQEYRDLSAIAYLHWVPNESSPPEGRGSERNVELPSRMPSVPAFTVYHSPWLDNVDPLSPTVFDDGCSVQVCPTR